MVNESNTSMDKCQAVAGLSLDEQLDYLRDQTKAMKRFSRLSQKLLTRTDQGLKTWSLQQRVEEAYKLYTAALEARTCIVRKVIEENRKYQSELAERSKEYFEAKENVEEVDPCTLLSDLRSTIKAQRAQGLKITAEAKVDKLHLQNRCYIRRHINLDDSGDDLMMQVWARKLLKTFRFEDLAVPAEDSQDVPVEDGPTNSPEDNAQEEALDIAGFHQVLLALKNGTDGEGTVDPNCFAVFEADGNNEYIDPKRICAWIEFTHGYVDTPAYKFLRSFEVGCSEEPQKPSQRGYSKRGYEKHYAEYLTEKKMFDDFEENYEKFVSPDVDADQFCQDIQGFFGLSDSIMDDLDWMSTPL